MGFGHSFWKRQPLEVTGVWPVPLSRTGLIRSALSNSPRPHEGPKETFRLYKASFSWTFLSASKERAP